MERRDPDPAHTPGKIVIPGVSPIACSVTNISEKGATLGVTSLLGIPEAFELMIGTDPKRRQCKVIEKAPNRLGVVFQ
jgi:hypothetical protein